MIIPCDMCTLLKNSADFTGKNCLKCGLVIRDECVEDLNIAEDIIRKNRKCNMIMDDLYDHNSKYCFNYTYTMGLGMLNCDIYTINSCGAKNDLEYSCSIYTSRELIKKYEISIDVIKLLRIKITSQHAVWPPKPTKFTIYRLYTYTDNCITCPNVIEEYLRYKQYKALLE